MQHIGRWLLDAPRRSSWLRYAFDTPDARSTSRSVSPRFVRVEARKYPRWLSFMPAYYNLFAENCKQPGCASQDYCVQYFALADPSSQPFPTNLAKLTTNLAKSTISLTSVKESLS